MQSWHIYCGSASSNISSVKGVSLQGLPICHACQYCDGDNCPWHTQVLGQLREFKNLPPQQQREASNSEVAALHYALKAKSDDLLANKSISGAIVGVVKKV